MSDRLCPDIPVQVFSVIDPADLFSGLPPTLRKRCRCAFLQGRIDQLVAMGRPVDKERARLAQLEKSHA